MTERLYPVTPYYGVSGYGVNSPRNPVTPLRVTGYGVDPAGLEKV
jgi:hypothetical protein